MKVGSVHICLDCDEIYERSSGNIGCPACASLSSIPLAKFIKPMTSIKGGNPEKVLPIMQKYITRKEKRAYDIHL